MTEIYGMGLPDKGKSTIKEKEIIWLKRIIVRSDCVYEDQYGTVLKMSPLLFSNSLFKYYLAMKLR